MTVVSKNAHRLHPRLRVVGNGDGLVNACRAKISTQVSAGSSSGFSVDDIEDETSLADLQTGVQTLALGRDSELLKKGGFSERQKLETRPPADTSFVNVIIDVVPSSQDGDDAATEAAVQKVATLCEKALDKRRAPPKVSEVVTRRNQISATIPVSFLAELSENEDIGFVSVTDPLKLDVPTAESALRPTNRSIGKKSLHKDGEGLLVGIIDVGGFDFTHADFLDDNGQTRFLRIWDQGGDFRAPPSQFDYGSEFTAAHLNQALAASGTTTGLPAHLLEPQSQQSRESHATHVASIAAGNSGVCRKAQIIGVLVDVPVPEGDFEQRRETFAETSRVVHAVEYLLEIARQEQKPITINISLGTNGGAHDGLSATSRWLDNALSQPNRAITLAAGNSGQEVPQHAEDYGWIMGRIHSNGRIASRGLETELEWVVVGNGIADVSENELEIWYSPQDRMEVEVLPPGETRWLKVKPQEFIENKRLSDGTMVSIYNELFHPSNGENYIAIYLSPHLKPGEIRGVRAGVWRVRLIGDEIRNGRFHCWIERDDPHEFGVEDGQRIFRFPSFFSATSNVDSHSVSSLACGRATISVANYDAATNRMNVSSSQGPTRDNRMKPDLCAPGTNIVAANGFLIEGDTPWVSQSGTSMASPYIAGVVGLMMVAADTPLNSLQCLGILQRTAKPLPGGSYDWVNDAGFGRIDPEAAITEARNFNARIDKS